MNITHCECVFVALGVRHAMRMRHIAICGLPRSTVFFHIISQTARFSKKKIIEIIIVFGVSIRLLSQIFCILRRNERDVVQTAYRSSCKVPVIIVRF